MLDYQTNFRSQGSGCSIGPFFILAVLILAAILATSDLSVLGATNRSAIILPDTGTGVTDPPYTIQPGDTLDSIAVNHNLTVPVLLQYNPQITDPLSITPGQVINIPVFENQQNIGGAGDLSAGGTSRQTYTVQRGDTLYRIALNYNVTVEAILNANPQITNRNLIYPGQVLSIPLGG